MSTIGKIPSLRHQLAPAAAYFGLTLDNQPAGVLTRSSGPWWTRRAEFPLSFGIGAPKV